jgi:hypothetical protein
MKYIMTFMLIFPHAAYADVFSLNCEEKGEFVGYDLDLEAKKAVRFALLSVKNSLQVDEEGWSEGYTITKTSSRYIKMEMKTKLDRTRIEISRKDFSLTLWRENIGNFRKMFGKKKERYSGKCELINGEL